MGRRGYFRIVLALMTVLPAVVMGNSPGADLHSDWVQRCAPVPVLSRVYAKENGTA